MLAMAIVHKRIKSTREGIAPIRGLAGYPIEIALNAEGGAAPEWIEIIPTGKFFGRDGRGPFFLDDPDAVIRATGALKMEGGIPIDYDHATDFAAPEGRPAPAAGWVKELKAERGAIMARVEWTPRATEMLKAKEYRFVSPVFEFERPPGAEKDAQTGAVVRLLRAALTNNPNLVMTAIAAANKAGETPAGTSEKARRAAMAKKSTMDALIEQIQEAADQTGMPVDYILESLSRKLGGDLVDPDEDGGDQNGEPVSADEPEPGASGGETEEQMARRHDVEMAAFDGDDDAQSELMARQNREREELMARRVKSSRSAAALDPSKFVSVARFRGVISELNQLKADRARERAEAQVERAVAAGKLPPSQRDWALAYCARDVAGFAAFVDKQPILLPQSDGSFAGIPPGIDNAARLNNTELAVCAQFGLKPEEFVSARRARRSMNARIE